MRKFFIWFCATLVAVTLLLITLSGCVWDGCIPGDASRECIMRAVRVTETFGAGEWHIQQTEMAK